MQADRTNVDAIDENLAIARLHESEKRTDECRLPTPCPTHHSYFLTSAESAGYAFENQRRVGAIPNLQPVNIGFKYQMGKTLLISILK